MKIPPYITKLTGITNEMVSDAPKFYEIAKEIVQMTQGNIFVAHNVFFDFNFIKGEFSDLGYAFKREKLCTVRLSRKFLPGLKSYSLGRLCTSLNIPISNRHRAMGDASATVEVLKLILKKQNKVSDEIIKSKKIILPGKLKLSNYESLPNEVGVYYFYGENSELLYIGKSNQIKKRVTGHLRKEMKRKKDIELRKAVAYIDYKLTGNELAALLIECHQIKELKPLFNVALKTARTPVSVELVCSNQLYEIRTTTLKSELNPFYTFKNKKRAQRFIREIYLSFLGSAPDDLNFYQDKKRFYEKFSVDLYNELLSYGYNRFIPKFKSFYIDLPGRQRGEVCKIKVQDQKYISLSYYNGYVLTEEFNLSSHSDLIRILFKYISKYRLKINPI